MSLESLALIVFVGLSGALLLWGLRKRQQVDDLEISLAAVNRDLKGQRDIYRELLAELNALADVTLDALLIVNQAHTVVVANKAAQTIFNQRGDLVGRTVMAVTRDHELDSLIDAVLKADEQLETQLVLDERSYRVRALTVALEGRPAVAIAMQDISEMVRLARARRDMVTNIMHDLGTPLNSISVLVERLTSTYGVNPDKDRDRLAKIQAQTDSLLHISSELMDLATIESGKAIMRMVTVDLEELVRSTISLMTTQAEGKKQYLSSEIHPGLKVLADPEQTRRVLSNLLHNAVKFTAEGGSIRVTASPQADMVKICVVDNGPGIPPADRSRIFERFYQVDASRTGQKSKVGAGLGLSIAKHIVNAQGGDIWAEPNIPQGACLCFTLALAADPTPAPPR